MPTELDELFDDNIYTDSADQVDHSVRRWERRHDRGLDGLLDSIDEQADGVVGQANVAPIRNAVQLADNALEQASDTYEALAESVTSTYDDVTGTASSLTDLGIRLAESTKDAFLGSPGAAVDPVGAVADFTADAVTMGLADIGEAADQAIDSMSKWADEMGDTGFEPLDTLLEPLGDAVAAQLDMAGEAIDATITAIEDAVDAANQAVQDAVDWAEGAVNDAWDWLGNGGRTDEQRAADEAAEEEAVEWAEDQADAAQEWADYLTEREAEEAAGDDADGDTTTTDGGRMSPPVEQPGGGDLSNQMQRVVDRAADTHERIHIVDPIDEHGAREVPTTQSATLGSGGSEDGGGVVTPLTQQVMPIADDDLDDITVARHRGPSRAQMSDVSEADPEPSSHGPGGAQLVDTPDPIEVGQVQTIMPTEEVSFVMADDVVEIDLDLDDDDALDMFNDHSHHHGADDIGPMTANHLDLGDSE